MTTTTIIQAVLITAGLGLLALVLIDLLHHGMRGVE